MILGHERVVNFLERAIASDRLAQAYVFVGPEKVGKTTVVRWLVGKLLDIRILKDIEDISHADFFMLSRLTDEKTGKRKAQIGVDQIRELNEKLAMTSFMGGRKIAFIEEADRMNAEAANALLKTLEEPAAQTTLILRASSIDQLLPTIVSRCQVLRFSLVPRKRIEAGLKARGISGSEAEELGALAAGRPGHAFRLLKDSQVRAEEEAATNRLCELTEQPLSHRLAAVGSLLPKEDVNRAESLRVLLDRFEWTLRDLLLAASGAPELVVHTQEQDRFVRLATGKPALHWAQAIEKLQAIRQDLAGYVNPHLALEKLMLVF